VRRDLINRSRCEPGLNPMNCDGLTSFTVRPTAIEGLPKCFHRLVGKTSRRAVLNDKLGTYESRSSGTDLLGCVCRRSADAELDFTD
jgi:hypothetical protein